MGAVPSAAGESFSRALLLQGAGRNAEAKALYRLHSAAGDPFEVAARINLAVLLHDEGRYLEALGEYRAVLAQSPADPVAWNNMGNTLMKLGRFPEAIDSFRSSLALAPACLATRLALGAALQREGDAPGAIACFRETLARDPLSPEAHWNLALALLLTGEFREGWQEYQWRWRRDSFTSPRRQFIEPSWDGSPLLGRRILVHGEQGLGDTLQFSRYLPLVAAAGGRVLAECQSASLVPLLEQIPGVSAVCVMGEELPPFDLQVPLMSLPFLFGTTLKNIPGRLPYLAPPAERVACWHDRITERNLLKVGVVWRGKRVPDPFRSSTLEELAPLGTLAGVTLFSLQLSEGGEGPPAGVELVDLTEGIQDFGDTAALISLLDLVISVDTSVAHLAGALGKPVWLMLPKGGDWRWLSGREDSPWYPSMRIFRQVRQGEWGEVIGRIVAMLRERAGSFLGEGTAREPFNWRRMYHLGEHLAEQGRHQEAVVRFTKASLLSPSNWEPHYSLGRSLQQTGRVSEARESFMRGLALGGEGAILHEALGITQQQLGELEGAIASYRQALCLEPERPVSRYNLATAMRDAGRFAEALEGCRELVKRHPDHPDGHWNLALLLLLSGDLPGGWGEFPWRYRKSTAPTLPRWQDHPRWDGSPFSGQTLLVWGEEGLGDTLQFVRYLPLVASRGGRVLVELQSGSLTRLIGRVAGGCRLLVAGETPEPFDLQLSFMELPALFATELSTIPASIPYLESDPELVRRCQGEFRQDGSFRVGLVWRGNPRHGNDARRSLAVELLGTLAGIPGVSFYSLQGGGGEAELARVPGLGVHPLAHLIGDFSDTAALAVQLDLIVTVDTSVAHLGGALGLPVWVMLPFVPDWRWLLGRDDSPWYPTMRLFRQKEPGGWSELLVRVREALSRAAAPRRGDAGLCRAEAVQEQYPEAVRVCQRFLAEDPLNVGLLNNLGCALDNGGRHEEAVAVYQRVLTLEGGFAVPHYNMGNSLRSLGRPLEAISCYRRALLLDPGLTNCWHNLGVVLQGAGELDEAKNALERALVLRPDYPEAEHNLGELHQARGDLDRAIESFRRVIARHPDYLPSWNALGIALQAMERLDEAAGCYLTALARKPDYLHALNNLGTLSRAKGDYTRAQSCYLRVLQLDPGYVDARWNLALVELLLGDFEKGWQGYEMRFVKADPVLKREFPEPLWDGGELRGRVILLHAEQGFGDAIQFVRYAATLAGMGGWVLVEGQSEAIAPVLATTPGVARVLVRGEPLPRFDCHAPLMSLPLLCGTRLETVPASIPYLSPEPRLVELWRSRMPGGGLRVGLAWAGRKSYKADSRRSIPLELFAPLAAVAGVRFYALQVGAGAEQLSCPPAGLTLTDLGGGIRDFSDSAAIIAHLDLVISVDSAVAHMAGALGRPVWVLLPQECDWRWLLGREDSPWYPSARLFRQSRRGEWGEVLERVAQELQEEVRVAGRGNGPAGHPVGVGSV